MLVRDYLRSLTAYPVPEETITAILEARGFGSRDLFTASTNDFRATADLYRWLSTAPDLSQGGQSYNLTDQTRAYYRQRANDLYRTAGELDEIETKTQYGYKGDRL